MKLTPRQEVALWFPCGTGAARNGHPQIGDIYRSDLADDSTHVILSTRLTVDVFNREPPVWHAEMRVYEPAVLHQMGIEAGEPVPHEMHKLDGEDKQMMHGVALKILAGVGDLLTDHIEETRYGYHVRRRLTPDEITRCAATTAEQEIIRQKRAAQPRIVL